MPINNYLIIGVNPANNEKDVPLDKRISITFAKDMTRSTISSSTLMLQEVNGLPIPCAVTYNSNLRTAHLQPTEELLEDTEYEVQVASGMDGVRSITDDYLDVPRSYQFTTRNTAALSKPLNVDVTAENGYPIVTWHPPTNFDITSDLSYEVKISASNLEDAVALWPGDGDINQTKHKRMNVPKKFDAGDNYYAYVRALNGSETSGWAQFQFHISPPETTPVAPPVDSGSGGGDMSYFDVTDTYPRQDSVDVTPEQIIIMFSADVDLDSVVNNGIYLVKRPMKKNLSMIDFMTDYAPSKKVVSTIEPVVDGSMVTLSVPLEDDAEYTVIVRESVKKSMSNTSLGIAHAWSFITAYTQLYGDPSLVRRDLGTLSDSISDKLLYSYLKEASDYAYQIVSNNSVFSAADYTDGNAPYHVHQYTRLRASYDLIMNSQMRSGGGGTTTNISLGDLRVEKDASTGGSVSGTLSGIKQQMKFYLDLMHGHNNRGYAKPVVVVRGENVEAYPDFLTRTEFRELGQ